jgi:C4-dicarboxylate-specific signal transduction histidine kinase
MNSPEQFTESEDLAFMGKVNASISHELKNIMAIISETSGLMNDIIEMAEKGKKIELETIKDCCKDIEEEIGRGFMTIKQMNRFAHSVDEPVKNVELDETLDLMINLAGFLSFACPVRFAANTERGLQVQTSAFRLQNLIHQALVFAFNSAGTRKEIIIGVHSAENDGIRIVFSGFETLNAEIFPTEKSKKTAAAIGAKINVSANAHEFNILISRQVDT